MISNFLKNKIARRALLTGLAGTAGLSLFHDRIPFFRNERKPNVLFIAIDDLNDWIGALAGHEGSITPNIDRLAARGMLFTNAHCPAPVCNPSRTAVMTGISPTTSRLYENSDYMRENTLLRDAVTIPQHLTALGYDAIGSGKIFHRPDPQSWRKYWPSLDKHRPVRFRPPANKTPLNGIPDPTGQHFDWGGVDAKPGEMGDWKVADWVVEQLGREHDAPLFLGCGFTKPHLRWFVPHEYLDRFPLEDIRLPEINERDLEDIPRQGKLLAHSFARGNTYDDVIKYGQWKNAVQAYLASISFTDDCLGRVLDALDQGPHKDNTIIVLWSDHGWHLGEKLHWRKKTLWEEATRIPLIICPPAGMPKTGKCAAPVSLLDIYPTLIELCGLDEKNNLEGQSLVPLLNNPDLEWRRPAVITLGGDNHAVRTRHYRYIRYQSGGEELYDHRTDPNEWRNLAHLTEYKDKINELKKWLPDE